jgi:hypothetical protein
VSVRVCQRKGNEFSIVLVGEEFVHLVSRDPAHIVDLSVCLMGTPFDHSGTPVVNALRLSVNEIFTGAQERTQGAAHPGLLKDLADRCYVVILASFELSLRE